MRIRQVVFVARELEPLVEDLCAVFGTEVAFRDPGVGEFGLRNAVMPVGDQFLEVVSPVEAGAAAARYLERRKGDGGYMLILQTADLDRDERRFASLGVRVVWKVDLGDIRTRHLHPKDTGGTLLSLDQADPPSSWRWAGPRWETIESATARRIAAVEVQSHEPDALAQRWSEVLALPAAPGRDGALEIPLERGAIRFVEARDGRGEGLGGFDVEVADRERASMAARARALRLDGSVLALGGVRIRLVSAG